MFDHLTTDELLAHIARLTARLQQPSSIAYTLQDIGSDNREREELAQELARRQQTKP